MTQIRLALLATAALVLPAAPALADHHAAPAAAEAAAPESAHDRLHALFADADARELALSPLGRLFRGDDKDADRLGDFLTDSQWIAARTDTKLNLALLALIDRADLNETDQLAYDVFKYQQETNLAGQSDEIRDLTEVRPINHFAGFHTFYPGFASGDSAAQFKTLAHYDDNLKRHDDYIAITDRAIARSRDGMESGVVETKLTIDRTVKQLDTLLAIPQEDSMFMKPAKNFPADFSDADKARLTAAYEAKTAALYAAHARLRDFLRDEYLPVAREEVGLSQMKGGDKLYALMIEQTTTLPLKADYLHDLGLSEVARIKGDLEKIKAEVRFKGTLNEFFDYARNDPKFHPKSRESLTQSYYDIGKQVDKQIGKYFSVLPKTPLVIKPYDESIEQFSAGGSYQQGSPDGSRPGTFFFNAYDLPSRLTSGNVTLYLHEGAPGHHFQISLAQENEALPAFMRFGGNTAYVEGWALYAETLGYEMGFFKDPWNRYGTLQDEQLRAMRLVVDTGLHSKGWSREQAIKFMMENSGMTET
ncbi:MAG: DUF885 family protein, partial [Sphingomonadaceae bacterium]|nr:DUF885 family protein [Sphingomonadaceae bacterium]